MTDSELTAFITEREALEKALVIGVRLNRKTRAIMVAKLQRLDNIIAGAVQA